MAKHATGSDLREQIQIQSASRSADGGGSARVTFSTSATVSGAIRPTGGNERFFADQLEGVTTHIITIRFRNGLTHANRLVQVSTRDSVTTTRTFNIKRVIDRDNRHKYLDILCEEGVAT